MDEKRKKLLDKLLDELETGDSDFSTEEGKIRLITRLKKWESLEQKEKEILETVAKITAREDRKRKIWLSIITGVAALTSIFVVYFYLTFKAAIVSYSMLPGGIQEIKLRNGNAWINGNTRIDVNERDSSITLNKGEIFLSKDDSKKTYTVFTPENNQVLLIEGNVNIISREDLERITSLGVVSVVDKKDTFQLKYGNEYRSDSGRTYTRMLQSPLLAGSFRTGTIAFENESVVFVIKQLSAFYGVKINYTVLPNVVVSLIAKKDEHPLDVLRKIIPTNWTIRIEPSGEYTILQGIEISK